MKSARNAKLICIKINLLKHVIHTEGSCLMNMKFEKTILGGKQSMVCLL